MRLPARGGANVLQHRGSSGVTCMISPTAAPSAAAKQLSRHHVPLAQHRTATALGSSSGAFQTGSGVPLQLAPQQSRHAVRQRSQRRCVTRACGIIGIHKQSGKVNVELYEGLLSLQHRGQDSAGMVTWDTADADKFHERKDNGLVSDVFSSESRMAKLPGSVGIGHVRYPTAGSASAQEAQPFFVNSPLGIYLIHNGNLTNAEDLSSTLNSSESFFNRHLRTDSDSEVLLNVLADAIHRAHQRCLVDGACDPNLKKMDLVFEAGTEAMGVMQGSYSCLCLVHGVGMVAFRDPYGIRPLVLGKRDGAGGPEYCIASEDCAFGPIGYKRVRDVRPGEMLVITPEGELVSRQCVESRKTTPCIFEYIYLARPDSVLNDIPVYNFQLGLGRRLADRIKQTGWDIDCVVPVPDGSRPAAIEISAQLGLPYREGLVKNRYVGRTFIMPDQRLRELSVRRKLNAMPAVFEGRNVLLVDDSIVRGTTMSQIVEMVRRAGAKKVFLASASPPVRYPNVYGVDMPTRREFVANELSEEQIQGVLGADGLLYQTHADLVAVGHELNPDIDQFEDSCFTGKYVTGDVHPDYLAGLEESIRVVNRDRAGASANNAGGMVAAAAGKA